MNKIDDVVTMVLGHIIGTHDDYDQTDNGFQVHGFLPSPEYANKFKLPSEKTIVHFDLVSGIWEAYVGPEFCDVGSTGKILDLFKEAQS